MIRMRHVRNAQCTPDSFIQFSVHLVRRLAGEVPWLTPIPQTAKCLQHMSLNIARYTGNLQISLLTWDINVPFLNVMSWESFKSRLIMLLRCFILRVHASGEWIFSWYDTCRGGGITVNVHAHDLLRIERDSEEVSQMRKRAWNAWTESVTNQHHRHKLSQDRNVTYVTTKFRI